MTSLRMRVIEAGADVLETMALSHDNSRDYRLQTMNLALDAMLDCLTENADEWVDAATSEYTDSTGLTKYVRAIDALAVLRED